MHNPEDVLKTWMAAVNGGDPQALIALYASRAVLIPTFSNRLLSKPEQIPRTL